MFFDCFCSCCLSNWDVSIIINNLQCFYCIFIMLNTNSHYKNILWHDNVYRLHEAALNLTLEFPQVNN